jgi:hypothetical protein
MTQAEAFERSLVRGSDATVLHGKLLGNSTLTVTPAVLATFAPGLLGVRAGALAAIFSRYRFKYIRIKWLAFESTSSSASAALGVYDEGSTAEGTAPTTVNGVMELRASSSSLVGQTVPAYFEWRPADTKLWLFTAAGATGSDPRLNVAGILYGASNPAAASSFELDFCIVYKGAVDIGTS